MIARRFTAACSISVLALMTACASHPRHEEPVAVAPGNAAYSQFGNVTDIAVVSRESRASGGGAVVGAVLGAVIGNQIGSGSGRAAATGLGAVGGAVVGNNVENRNRAADEIYRVSVRLDNGRVDRFDYQRIEDLRVGDRVKVEGGQLFRV